MIEKVRLGKGIEPQKRGYCICGCTCAHVSDGLIRGEGAADWVSAE